jgi:hypothetical protein
MSWQSDFPVWDNAFPTVEPEPELPSNVPTPQEYRQARAIVKRYQQAVATNHWRNKAEEIVASLKIKDKAATAKIERILRNEV